MHQASGNGSTLCLASGQLFNSVIHEFFHMKYIHHFIYTLINFIVRYSVNATKKSQHFTHGKTSVQLCIAGQVTNIFFYFYRIG